MADLITRTVKRMGGWRVVVAIIVAIGFLWWYNGGKIAFPLESYSGNVRFSPSELNGGGGGGGGGDVGGGVKAAAPIGQNSAPAPIQGIQGTPSTGGSAATQNIDPAELLPKDANASWTGAAGSGDVMNINMLDAGHFQGTVSQSMRNPNLQIRSEPPNPRVNTGQWNQSTIETDNHQRGFEIGSA